MNTKRTGDIGENIAAEYLAGIGYKILERNAEYCGVEVDIIAKHGGTLIFVEVKTRGGVAYGTPAEAVTRSKQNRYRTAANGYIVLHRVKSADVRFDVVEILDREVNHIEDAF